MYADKLERLRSRRRHQRHVRDRCEGRHSFELAEHGAGAVLVDATHRDDAAREVGRSEVHPVGDLESAIAVGNESVDHLALLAIAEGRDACAAQLIGYADAGYARLQKGRRVQNEQRSHTRAMAHLVSQYRREQLATLMFEGANASEDEVIAAALQ
jgi:hypothetical protein